VSIWASFYFSLLLLFSGPFFAGPISSQKIPSLSSFLLLYDALGFFFPRTVSLPSCSEVYRFVTNALCDAIPPLFPLNSEEVSLFPSTSSPSRFLHARIETLLLSNSSFFIFPCFVTGQVHGCRQTLPGFFALVFQASFSSWHVRASEDAGFLKLSFA